MIRLPAALAIIMLAVLPIASAQDSAPMPDKLDEETAWLTSDPETTRALLALGVAPAIVSETFLLCVRQTAHLNSLLGGSQACVCVRI